MWLSGLTDDRQQMQRQQSSPVLHCKTVALLRLSRIAVKKHHHPPRMCSLGGHRDAQQSQYHFALLLLSTPRISEDTSSAGAEIPLVP